MNVLFDKVISRKNTGSYKWDTTVTDGVIEKGAYPLSVADMEFSTPPEVKSAIKDFADNGFFCYTDSDFEYRDCIREFLARRHDFYIENEWITCVGGVVFAINTAIRAFTDEGDKVIIQSPVYYPFKNSIENNGRIVADNPLIKKENTYEMNFDELEVLASQPDVKLMLLCSPHNPVGRVWSEEELKKVGEICLKNNVVLLSDEIHFDILRNGKKHTVINNADLSFSCNTVVCTAVSKSFNLAGLGTSNIIISNDTLRQKFRKQLTADGYSCINCVSRPATIAAYTKCDYWLDAMNSYIDENIRLVKSYIDEIEQIKMYDCEGTYLVWLDMSDLGFDDEQLDLFLRNECGIIQDPGIWFGENGKGFARFNVACPKEVLKNCLDKMKNAIKQM